MFGKGEVVVADLLSVEVTQWILSIRTCGCEDCMSIVCYVSYVDIAMLSRGIDFREISSEVVAYPRVK